MNEIKKKKVAATRHPGRSCAVILSILADIATVVALVAAAVLFLWSPDSNSPALISTATLAPTPPHKVVVAPSDPPVPTEAETLDAGQPQLVRWGPSVDRDAGICLDSECNTFIPWIELRDEVESKLLPEVDSVPLGSTVRLGDLEGKKNWVMEIVDPNRVVIGNAWFGYNPLDAWSYDGLVRIGTPQVPPAVWATFQRYSDGSYHGK